MKINGYFWLVSQAGKLALNDDSSLILKGFDLRTWLAILSVFTIALFSRDSPC